MESWRKVWREGVAPNLSTRSLEALKSALERNDPKLVQGVTSVPLPGHFMDKCTVEGACALGYCGWKGEGLQTIGEVENYFAEICQKVDEKLGEPAAIRWFTNWFDDNIRGEMIKQLLPEVVLALQQREELAPTA